MRGFLRGVGVENVVFPSGLFGKMVVGVEEVGDSTDVDPEVFNFSPCDGLIFEV